jgi:hypothetical protein
VHRSPALILALIALLAAVSGAARMAHDAVAHHPGDDTAHCAEDPAHACEPRTAPATASSAHVCGIICLFFGHASNEGPAPLVPPNHPDCATCTLLTTLTTFSLVAMLAYLLSRLTPPRFLRPTRVAPPRVLALAACPVRGPPRHA